MGQGEFEIRPGFMVNGESVVRDPDDDFFRKYLEPYYLITRDGQYLFASMQAGRRPDRVFYMTPEGYRLGRQQKPFPEDAGKQVFEIVEKYLKTTPLLIQDGIQGEDGYETGLRVVLSLRNPHTAYIGWMGRLMVFPPRKDMKVECWNYIVPELLPWEYIKELQEVWPEYVPGEPLTLYDFTEAVEGVRARSTRCLGEGGAAFKGKTGQRKVRT